MRLRHQLLCALLATTALACGGESGETPDARPANTGSDGSTSNAVVVVLETTLGNLTLELDNTTTPNTTANFLGYVDSGFYDGTLVHRVVDDWVIQGGGYTTGLSSKTPGPAIDLEIGALSHVHGAISMARDPSDPDSATSQWFIVDWPASGTAPQPSQLDGEFAVFGKLTDGFSVLEAITQVSVHGEAGLTDVPDTEVVVTRAIRVP